MHAGFFCIDGHSTALLGPNLSIIHGYQLLFLYIFKKNMYFCKTENCCNNMWYLYNMLIFNFLRAGVMTACGAIHFLFPCPVVSEAEGKGLLCYCVQ